MRRIRIYNETSDDQTNVSGGAHGSSKLVGTGRQPDAVAGRTVVDLPQLTRVWPPTRNTPHCLYTMSSASAAFALHPTGPHPVLPSKPSMDRRLPIVIAVVGFHVLGLWALQVGLLHRAVELVVPVSVLSDMIEPPQPQVTPTPPQPLPRQAPVPKATSQPRQAAQPSPQPVAMATPTPEPQAPSGVVEPQPPAPPVTAIAAAEPAAPAAPPAPPAPPRIELPSSDAAHLNNPLAPYPNLSRRLGETGVVQLRVFVETDGSPSQVQVFKSSGYERLDQSALENVKNRWRFIPGKRNGVPIAAWVIQPVRFELTTR